MKPQGAINDNTILLQSTNTVSIIAEVSFHFVSFTKFLKKEYSSK